MSTVNFKVQKFNNAVKHRDKLDTLGDLYVIQCKSCDNATVARTPDAITLRLWVGVDLEKRNGTCPVCAHDQGIARAEPAPYRQPTSADRRLQAWTPAYSAKHRAAIDARQYARLAQGLEAIREYQRLNAHAPPGPILGTLIGCGTETAKGVLRELERRGLLVYGGNSKNVQRRYRSLVSLEVTL